MENNSRWTSGRALVFAGIAFFMFAGSAILIGAEEAAAPAKVPGFWDIWILPRVWVGAVLGFMGLALLMSGKLKLWMRLIALAVAFFAFAIVSNLPWGSFAQGMGLHPSPMCTVEKPFLFVHTGRAVPIVFVALLAFMGVMSLIGNKLFCGWNCPIGAIQEILHRLPVPRKWQKKLPFRVTNSIRILLFVSFVGFLLSLGFSVFAYINPFEFLHWRLEWAVLPAFLVTFVAALFVYRPFCYLACPVGLLTWPIEQVSVLKVRLDKNACTNCMRCVKESPCPTVPAILEGARIRPDCHACGACIEACPEDALKFK